MQCLIPVLIHLKPCFLSRQEDPIRLAELQPMAISLRGLTMLGNLTVSADALSTADACESRVLCSRPPLDIRCLLPDDAFAVMPASLAPLYFGDVASSTAALRALAKAKASGLLPKNEGAVFHFSNESTAHCRKCSKHAGGAESLLRDRLSRYAVSIPVAVAPFR